MINRLLLFAFAALAACVFLGELQPRSSRAMAQEPEQSALEQRIASLERQELDAIKSGNMDAFSDLLADDAVFLNSRGFGDKALVVKNTAAFKLEQYSMENIKVVRLSDNSGLIAYKLTEKGSAHGNEIAGTVYASAVWTERSGKWLCVFSQETPAR
jgi:hypothetical protein